MSRTNRVLSIPNFKLLFESAPGLYLVLHPDLSIQAVSDAYLRATMTCREDVLGRVIFDVFPDNPGDSSATGVDNLRTSLQRVLQDKVPHAMGIQKYDIRRPESEGGGFEERFWSSLNTPVIGLDGNACYIIHRVEDVTDFVRLRQRETEQQDRAERMESEIFLRAQQVQQAIRKLETAIQELARLYDKAKERESVKIQLFSEHSEEDMRSSEERYRHLFEVHPQPMWVYDLESLAILAVNNSAIKKYGYSRDEFLGMTIVDIGPSTKNGAARHQKKNGSVLEVELTCLKLPFEGKAARLVAATDVSEKKRIETQFLRTQRMESIETLAGGIAHELNSVLAPILMSVQLLREKSSHPDSQRLLETLETSALRGAGIASQLRTFVGGVDGDRTPIQLKHVLTRIEQIVVQTFPKSVRIQAEIPRNLWLVVGDSTQLDRVFLDLCVNARDAMPGGGTLGISAENIILCEHDSPLNMEARSGLYVVIEVSDTGAGIPAGIIDKIFEPFFTTREFGEVIGLGLSTVRAIVKSHGGFVNVVSEAGHGTRFKVYLPRRESSEMKTTADLHTELPAGHGEWILVVDDEQAIREITKMTLESRNYNVVTARNGAEAVAFYMQRMNEIAVVLLDIMMPVMDGFATTRRLKTVNPNVRIVAASGLFDPAKMAALSEETGCIRAVLSKPYTAEKLLRTLRDVIGES